MNNIKKILICFLSLIIIPCISACANNTQQQPLLPPQPSASPSEVTSSEQVTASSEQVGEPLTQVEVKLYLNGNRLDLITPPVLKDGNVLVPFAEICGYFSRTIECTQDGDVLEVNDVKNTKKIQLTAGQNTAVVGGEDVSLSAATLLTDDGILLVELSSFRTLLDADNKYNEEFSAAYIMESGLC